MPRFSIITVNLNSGADLLRTAHSLDRQCCGDWEHIIQDGGSKDDSLNGLSADPRRHIYQERDQGIFDAMNKAIGKAVGDYCIFMNAGDVFHDDQVLDRVVRFIACADFPKVIYTHVRYRANGRISHYPSKLSRMFLYRRVPCQQAIFISMECFQKYGKFDLNFPCLADPEYFLRLCFRHDLQPVLCDIVGADFQGGGFSSTDSFRIKAKVERDRMRHMYFSTCERLLGALFLCLTMSELRARLVRNQRFTKVRDLYLMLSSNYNRFFGRL